MNAMVQPCAAIDAIRAGANTLAHSHAQAHARHQQHQVQQDISGIQAFVAWFSARHAAGEVTMSGDHMIDVLPALSRRFCIGLSGSRYYIGLPPEAREWFTAMPWLHATVGTASKSLSLVCERSRAPGAELSEFALNFELPVASIVKMLACYHYLDARWIEHTGEVRQDGTQPVLVGRDVVMTLDIRVIARGGGFIEVLDGRNPTGLQNRAAASTGVQPRTSPFAVDSPSQPPRRPDAIASRNEHLPTTPARSLLGLPGVPVPFGLKPPPALLAAPNKPASALRE